LAPLAWTSKLQSLVTTSTTEAEFVAAASAIKEGLWVLKLIREMHGEPHLNQMTLLCDNQAAISLMKQPSAGVQGRSKHIDVQFKFVKERCQKKHVDVEYISSTDQLADLFTKQQAPSVFAKMVQEIGLRPAPTGLQATPHRLKSVLYTSMKSLIFISVLVLVFCTAGIQAGGVLNNGVNNPALGQLRTI
jgi:hypothetical protein